jgi:putative DNA primase/helicase
MAMDAPAVARKEGAAMSISPPSSQSSPAIENIPDELKARRQWVVWRYEFRDRKWTKVPYQPAHPRWKAKTDDPSTWSTFDAAWSTFLAGGFDGIGYVFSKDDPYVGIDLDNCLKDGRPLEWARDFISDFAGTYGEISPSGNGVKLWCSGKLEGDGTRRNGFGPDGSGAIEMYDQRRFFAMTGQMWDETCVYIEEFPLEIAELYAKLKAPKSSKVKPIEQPAPAPRATSLIHTDAEVIAEIERNPKVRDLWMGYSGGHPSPSEADLALCNHLAFLCGPGRHDQVKRLFLQSGLGVRDKTRDRVDYLDKFSIPKAYENRSQYYSWPRPRKQGSSPPPSANGTGHLDAADVAVNEAEDDPHRLGRLFLKSREAGGKRTVVYHRGDFHSWDGTAYRPFPDHEVNAGTSKVCRQEFDRLNRIAIRKWEANGKKNAKDEETPKPIARKVGTRLIGDVAQAIRGETLLAGTVDPPAWLIDHPPFPAEDVLPTSNALVHLPSFVDGKAGAIAKPTPGFFCPYALDYPFNPDAETPVAWADFLASIWSHDPEAIDTLQEWMGHLLTPDASQQKIGVLIGPTRSGRGTISRVIRGLIGASNVASPTFSGLASHFGAACLIGKPVAIVGDARQSRQSDWAVALERLLMISGEDAIVIDRKNRPAWEGKLPTRLMLISNELPHFPDQSGALAGRFLLLRFTESFLGKEDRTLDAKLQAELPGILLWAIEGWKRLRNRGRFLQPKSGQDLIDQMRDLSSPVGAFIRERCEIGPGNMIPRTDLFQAWKDWCLDRNREPGSEESFGRNLRTACPHLGVTQPRDAQGKRFRAYEGIRLQPGPAF